MMKKSVPWCLMALLVFLSAAGCAQQSQQAAVTPTEAQAIAKEAYVYGFPMVVNYKSMYLYVIDKNSPEYKAEFNQKGCEGRLYTPRDKAVVTPNSDTPYCMSWADIRTEPFVITVPEIEADRFYEIQLIDLYTHNFAYISTIATGNVPGNYLLVGPGWQGGTPDGITAVIPCETPFFFSVIRTQVFGPEDLDRVKEIQTAYGFQPLSAFLGQEPPAAAPALDFPVWREGAQFDVGFFDYFDFMLSLVEPVAEEEALFKRFAMIGLGTDEAFDFAGLSPEMAEALTAGVKEGFAQVEASVAELSKDPLASAKIFGTRAFLQESAEKNYGQKDFFLMRTLAAHTGLYGNSGEEAIYPTYFVDQDGAPLDASANTYQVIFPAGQLPPVTAFWSLSMYDAKTQLFIDNSLDRYLLNSTMMDQIKPEADGSIVLHIAKDSPGADLEGNWLPAPDGPFYMVMRLYGPEPSALDGTWTPPPAVRVN